MRRIAILVLLFVGMQLILPLGTIAHAPQSETLMVFGFLLLAAYTMGEIGAALHLPKITGYLLAGLLFGPFVLGVVSPDVITELEPVNRLAIALIAFLAGAELRWSELKERWRAIMRILGTELLLSFLLISATLLVLQRYVPFLATSSGHEVFALVALFAAVAIVHSPAVTMAILTETKAHGVVARTTLGIVLVADVVVVLLFSGTLTIVRAVIPGAAAAGGLSAGTLAWEIGGSVLVGGLLGAGVALYLRFVQRELLMFAIVVTFFGAAIAQLLHVETLLTLLVAGFVTENGTKAGGRELLEAMERSAAPVFVVFFALAGASIHLTELAMMWPIALAVVAARGLGIFGGTRLGARMSNTGPAEKRYVWLGLISQAGVAIGLVTVVADAYPTRGAEMRTLFLAMIAINEIAGQILFRHALVASGEVQESRGQTADSRGSITEGTAEGRG
ncbi:MAG TPA: cation:proton antiporter [Gemmatimonadaceae bacterium]|nr:cation:proton antiporter [Gemmatimonadaceae bacterium]